MNRQESVLMFRPFVLLVLLMTAAGESAAMQFRPVTDEMLRDPDPADWPMIRRTYDAQSYSPLSQINRENVADLRLAWVWGIEPGVPAAYDQIGVVVQDGVLYLLNPGDVVQALEAATGELIWEFRHRIPQGLEGRSRTRGGVMLYDDKVIFYTADSRIVALDARDGRLVWQTPSASVEGGHSYFYSSTGIVVQGRVISGTIGCERFLEGSCFVSAHDAATGELLWQTNTVPNPGEPGGDTWADLPAEFRAGGDVWITGSYDPELRLLYWSTAQAKPWHRESRRTGDAALLYTNSTLALDPETGEIVWYYQYVPGESFDLDESFEFVLVDVGGRKSGFMMGKHAVLWHLDRETGELVRASDMGLQTVAEFDPERGFVRYHEGMIRPLGEPHFICPGRSGFRSWRAMAYHPGTQAFYIPMSLTCGEHTFGEVPMTLGSGQNGEIGRVDHYHVSDSVNTGQLLAVDVNGAVLWTHRQRAGFGSSVLSTGGGLAFVGDIDRWFSAFDVDSGEILWRTRLSTAVTGFPISFSVEGRQYIAVPTGWRGGHILRNIPMALTPEVRWPAAGNALYVFALSEEEK
jgi:alcohol dehydrogenase (cytochrome c)